VRATCLNEAALGAAPDFLRGPAPGVRRESGGLAIPRRPGWRRHTGPRPVVSQTRDTVTVRRWVIQPGTLSFSAAGRQRGRERPAPPPFQVTRTGRGRCGRQWSRSPSAAPRPSRATPRSPPPSVFFDHLDQRAPKNRPDSRSADDQIADSGGDRSFLGLTAPTGGGPRLAARRPTTLTIHRHRRAGRDHRRPGSLAYTENQPATTIRLWPDRLPTPTPRIWQAPRRRSPGGIRNGADVHWPAPACSGLGNHHPPSTRRTARSP